MLERPAEAKRMALAGRDRVLRLFTWAAVTDRVEAVYREVMQGGKAL